MRMFKLPSLVMCGLLMSTTVHAHDTWVETHTNLIRTGDAIYVDLKLGNHGNDHRDFKIASKIALEECTLLVSDPTGKDYDLKPGLIDTGYAPNEGYWKAKFVAVAPGLYTVSHTLDKVVNHGKPVRSIKSAKACFVVSPRLDQVSAKQTGFDRVWGHPLELIPVLNPVTPMGPGQELKVQVQYQGKVFPKTRVSFIPRGTTLADGMDAMYERTTDEQGIAAFTPKTGGQYLIVVHHKDETQSSSDYVATAYSATLTVFVPEVCPCCAE